MASKGKAKLAVAKRPDPPVAPLPEFLPGPPPEAPARRGPSEMARYLTILRRHRGPLLALAVLGAIVGASATRVQTPVFATAATVEIHIANENYLNLRDVNPTASATFYPEYDLQTQMRILTSRELVTRVTEAL